MNVEGWLYSLRLRVRSFFRPGKIEGEMKEELRQHLTQQINENLCKGMPLEEARNSAMKTMGGITRIEQQCRDAQGGDFFAGSIQDVRYGVRQLLRNPGFSITVVLCLALGIGANTAVFSWLEGILFRPYPAVANQERLYAVAGSVAGQTNPDTLSWPDFLDLRRDCTLCEDSFVSKITSSTLNLGDHAEVTVGSIVSANYFEAIGVHPMLGRGFESSEDVGNDSHPVVVISYQLWRDHFQADKQIIGKTQRLNNVPHTIIGVAPLGFYGTFVGRAIQFWVPVSMEETFSGGGYKLEDRGARWIEGYVRLKAGVSQQQAQQQISAIATRLQKDYPVSNRGRGISLWALWRTPFNHAGELLPTLEVMVAVVAFLLFIVCANVGNLLLVRSFARRREMSVRVAIGASRSRLLRQLLIEGLLLSALGTAGGFLIAYLCQRLLMMLLSLGSGVKIYLPGTFDGRVLMMSIGISLFVTLVVGLIPAFQSRKLNIVGSLKDEAGSLAGFHEKAWIRSGLVAIQVALSFTLLVGAVLLLESLEKVRGANPGFSTTTVAVTKVSVVAAGYDAARAKTFQNELIDRLTGLPGIESAAFAAVTPLGYAAFSSSQISVDGYQPAPDEQSEVEYNQVDPGYLATLGIPLLSGREFLRSDDEKAQPVVIVNRSMVLRYWEGQDPIGHRLQVKGHWLQVIGVAADSKYESLGETAKPFFYVPLRQDFVRQANLNIRTTQSLQNTLAAVLREVHAMDPGLALYEMITLQEQVNRASSPQLVAVTLVAALGGLALLLAGIGLYGVMSYAVAQSSRELGVRMALGADAPNLLLLVLSRGLRLSFAGILFGIFAALAMTKFIGEMLYNVSPHDPLVFGSAVFIMILTATTACIGPAWRASRTDPARILRD